MSELDTFARNAGTGPVLRLVSIANPDPGAGFTITPDAGRYWEVLSVGALLTVDESDQNRVPQLAYVTGATGIWLISAFGVVPSSGVAFVSFISGWSQSEPAATNEGVQVSMPRTYLAPDYALQVSAAGLQAADQFSMITAQVIETSTGEREYARTIAGRLAGRAEAIADLLTGDV